jgi:hypothetical protein
MRLMIVTRNLSLTLHLMPEQGEKERLVYYRVDDYTSVPHSRGGGGDGWMNHCMRVRGT